MKKVHLLVNLKSGSDKGAKALKEIEAAPEKENRHIIYKFLLILDNSSRLQLRQLMKLTIIMNVLL